MIKLQSQLCLVSLFNLLLKLIPILIISFYFILLVIKKLNGFHYLSSQKIKKRKKRKEIKLIEILKAS